MGEKAIIRSRRTSCFGAIALLMLAGSAICATAQDEQLLATVKNPLKLSLPSSTQAASRSGQLVIPVIGYQPPDSGTVTAVVVLHCGQKDQEIGRFGIFPQLPFTPQQPRKQQNFGILLSDDPACHDASQITISLDPELGDGAGAKVLLGPLRIEP